MPLALALLALTLQGAAADTTCVRTDDCDSDLTNLLQGSTLAREVENRQQVMLASEEPNGPVREAGAANSGQRAKSTEPNGCIPSPKLGDQMPCVYSDQCHSGFCCPFVHLCLADSAAEVNRGTCELDKGVSPQPPGWYLNRWGLKNMDDLMAKKYVCPNGAEAVAPDWDGCDAKFKKMVSNNKWVMCPTDDRDPDHGPNCAGECYSTNPP